MIGLNISYLRTETGPETLISVPSELSLDVEDILQSLLKISQYLPLKFFVYISSEELKNANFYIRLPNAWGQKAKELRLLVSIVLLDKPFTVLMRFEALLQEIVTAILGVKDVYQAFYENVMFKSVDKSSMFMTDLSSNSNSFGMNRKLMMTCSFWV